MTKAKKRLLRRDANQIDGVALIMAMLRMLRPDVRRKMLGKLAAGSPLLARLADHVAFIYNDIVRLEDSSIEKILTLIPERDWLVAWKLSHDKIKSALLRNMSERRRQAFVAEAERTPKMLRSDVVRTQVRIARTIQRELETGRLDLLSKPKEKSRKLKKAR